MKKMNLFITFATLLAGLSVVPVTTIEAASYEYSYEFASKQFSANGTVTLNGVGWTLAGDGGYWGYDGTRGQQFGSSSKPYKSLTFSTNGFNEYSVTKVVINTSGASSISATMKVTLGGVQFGNQISLSTTATEYTFTGEGSGELAFNYTQTSSKATYIKSIKVAYKDKDVEATEYYVNFNSNGGSSVDTQALAIPTSGYVYATKPTDPTKDGYVFGGWFADSSLTTAWDFETNAVTEDVTLYAKWNKGNVTSIADVTAGNTYHIKGEVIGQTASSAFYVQDATGGIEVNGASLEVGNEVSFVAKAETNNSKVRLINAADIEVTDAEDKTVDLTPITDATLITDANHGKYVELTYLKVASVDTGGKIVTLEGNNFTVYYSAKAAVEEGVDLVASLKAGEYIDVKGVNIAGNVCLTHIAYSKMFNVTFNSNGGSNVEAVEVLPNSKVSAPETPTKAPVDNTMYEFAGWYADEALQTAWDFENNIVTENITLYAKWNERVATAAELFTSNMTTAQLTAAYEKNTVVEEGATVYKQVTAEQTDWSGEYLIAYVPDNSTTAYIFNGVDEVNGYVSGIVDNGVLTSENDLTKCYATIEAMDSGYSIYINGQYAYRSSDSNGLDFKDTAQTNTISWDSSSPKIVSGGAVLRFNTAATQMRFRYYKSSSYTGQKAVTLFKKTTETVEKEVLNVVDSKITFGVKFPAEHYVEEAKYGLLLLDGTKVGTNSLTDLANGCSLSNFVASINNTYDNPIKYGDDETLTPVKVNENGYADENGEYYQYGVNVKNSLNNLDVSLVALAYVEVDGVVYVTKQTNPYSLRTLAQALIDTGKYADDALDVLNAIVTYVVSEE